jgi:hypothetical protein
METLTWLSWQAAEFGMRRNRAVELSYILERLVLWFCMTRS